MAQNFDPYFNYCTLDSFFYGSVTNVNFLLQLLARLVSLKYDDHNSRLSAQLFSVLPVLQIRSPKVTCVVRVPFLRIFRLWTLAEKLSRCIRWVGLFTFCVPDGRRGKSGRFSDGYQQSTFSEIRFLLRVFFSGFSIDKKMNSFKLQTWVGLVFFFWYFLLFVRSVFFFTFHTEMGNRCQTQTYKLALKKANEIFF